VSGDWYQWEEEDIRKGCSKSNMVEILCTHVWKWKNKTHQNYCKNRGWEIKENDGGGEFN
jgi:hypothetical protein